MRNFKNVLREINFSLNRFVIFQEMLTSILVFLGFFLIFTLIKFDFIDPLYATIPAGIYLGVELYFRIRRDKLILVESKFAFLNEKLRTASDNLDADNEIIESLQQEIVNDLKKVDTGAFLDMKHTMLKIGAILVLCFLVIFLNTFHIRGLSINIDDLVKKNIVVPSVKGNGGDLAAGGAGGVSDIPGDQDIFGMQNVAKLGDEQLSLGVKTLGYEINVRDSKEAEKREYDEMFPSDSDVQATSASAYEENIPKEQQEIVNNYFKELAK